MRSSSRMVLGNGTYFASVGSTITRPMYWPQVGQITCEGVGVLHLGQYCNFLATKKSCARRRPVREFD